MNDGFFRFLPDFISFDSQVTNDILFPAKGFAYITTPHLLILELPHRSRGLDCSVTATVGSTFRLQSTSVFYSICVLQHLCTTTFVL